MSKTTKIELTNSEFNFLVNLDNLSQASEYNFNLLKTNYLHTIIAKNGYEPNEDAQMTIDLKDESHTLTVKALDK